MDNPEQARAIRELQAKVRNVLLDQWDPIGIRDEPKAQDEYDSYVGRVTRLILSGGGDVPIAQLLHHIETDRMGLNGQSQAKLLIVAQALLQLHENR